jgi:hypothetical protein
MVESAGIDQQSQQQGEYQGLESVDMEIGRSYDAHLSTVLPLYGDEAQRAMFVEKCLPHLCRAGLLESIPTRVLSYQQSDRDEESQRFGAA